jgi:protein N-lysine methyltransferase METTL21D
MIASRRTHPVLPSATLPAHQTTHLDTIHCSNNFILLQKHNGTSTGNVLWLGAQCLSAYLATVHKSITLNPSTLHIRPRLLELGSGTGLTALVVVYLFSYIYIYC